MNFIRSLNSGNFYFSNYSFQICWLVRGMEVMKNEKCQLNISKIMLATPKKNMGV